MTYSVNFKLYFILNDFVEQKVNVCVHPSWHQG